MILSYSQLCFLGSGEQGKTWGRRVRLGAERQAPGHDIGFLFHGIGHLLESQGPGLAHLHTGGYQTLGLPLVTIVTLDSNNFSRRCHAIFMEPYDAVWTGHGAGSAVDASIRIDQDRIGHSIAKNRAAQTGQHAGCGVAMSAAIWKPLIVQTRSHMHP